MVWRVQRMGEEQSTKKILNQKQSGRRERPKRKWKEGIVGELKARGTNEYLWMDRNTWRLGVGQWHAYSLYK